MESVLLEIASAVLLWFGWKREVWKLLTLIGMTLVFLSYPFGLYWINPRVPMNAAMGYESATMCPSGGEGF